jgi:hypothetical protein
MDTAERTRLATNTDRVEALMRDGRWYSSLRIMEAGGLRGVGRLYDLKARGWHYDKRKTDRPGIYEYRLIPKVAEQLSLMEAS